MKSTDNPNTHHIFVGYDERAHEAFLVAKHTLEKHATVPIKVHKMHHRVLREAGLFKRTWTIEEGGQYTCNVDGRPFSTQFSHSRFLVPELWRNLSDTDKNPLTMFVDCDFLWTQDIGEMFKDIEEMRLKNNKATPIYCTQHDYKPKSKVKMDNMEQATYNMKLWSAMFVFDMEHEENQFLTPEMVNTEHGRRLNNFCWITDEHRIGVIDEKWHFVPNHSEKNTAHIAAIHYTEGGPWLPNYRNCRYADIWWKEYNDCLKSRLKSVNFDVERMIDGE